MKLIRNSREWIKLLNKTRKIPKTWCAECRKKYFDIVALKGITDEYDTEGASKVLISKSKSAVYDILCADCKIKYDEVANK